MADLADLFPGEDDQETYERLVADLPALPDGGSYNTREGSVLHGFLGTFIAERKRLLGYAYEAVRQSFLIYATDAMLDERAREIGVQRGVATRATVVLQLTGTAGLVVPVGSTFSTEGDPVTGEGGVEFATTVDVTLTGGTALVQALALAAGAAGNVGAGTVTQIVNAPSYVTAVTNTGAAEAGTDDQDDDSLRRTALARLSVFPESGNANTYIVAALSKAEVGVAHVDDRWDGDGTGMLVPGGVDQPYISRSLVEELQEELDPSVKNILHFEEEDAWTGGEEVIANPLEGRASRRLTSNASTTTAMQYDYPVSKSFARFSDPNDEVWLFVRRVSPGANLATTGALLVSFYMPGGESVAKAQATLNADAINNLADVTDRGHLKILKSDFTVTNGSGVFDWANVGGVKISLAASASGTAEVIFDGMRFARDEGGFPDGIVTLGIQLTVRSARGFQIAIFAEITPAVGTAVSDVQDLIESGIEEYFASLDPGSIIYITAIGNIIHDTAGVVDYGNIYLNGSNTNIQLAEDQRPILGQVQLV